MTISGRPILVLDGAQPSYRDLGPGMSGHDVRQLEPALKRSGIDLGPVDGRYDQATGSGVARLYARHGFRPVVATTGQLAAVRPTEAELVAGARPPAASSSRPTRSCSCAATPLRVAKAGVGPGAAPDGPVATVTDSVVAVDGALPVDQAQLVKVGAEVLLDEPALGIKANGRVSHVAPRPGTGGADQFHVFFEVVVPRSPARPGRHLGAADRAVQVDPQGAARGPAERSVAGPGRRLPGAALRRRDVAVRARGARPVRRRLRRGHPGRAAGRRRPGRGRVRAGRRSRAG